MGKAEDRNLYLRYQGPPDTLLEKMLRDQLGDPLPELAELKLRIYYDGPIDPDMDAKIQEIAETCGWTWYAQGTNLITGRRDLAFYRECK